MDLRRFGCCWFALQVKPRREQIIALMLRNKGYDDFVPYARYAYHNDNRFTRGRAANSPLYPGYVFCRFVPDLRASIVTTPGVIRIVGNGSIPIPVSDQEIEAIQLIAKTELLVQPWPFLHVGDSVLLTHGPLKGIRGILLRVKNTDRLIVSIDLLQRSIAIEVNTSWTEPVSGEQHGVHTCGPASQLGVLPKPLDADPRFFLNNRRSCA